MNKENFYNIKIMNKGYGKTYHELQHYIETLLKENQKYKEVIDKVKFAIKTNCIKNDKKYEEICCDGDYLLQILEDKEVE